MSIFSITNLKKAFKEPKHAVKRAIHIGAVKASIKLIPKRLPPPVVLTLFLTYRCNLNCYMCGQNKLFADFERQHLTPEQYAQILREFKILKPTICLFGGEPLLYPEFAKLVEITDKLGFRQHLITNGTLLEKLDETTLARLDRITVSINGPRDVHDKIVGVSGAFERAIRGIDKSINVARKGRARKPLVYVLVTVTQDNFEKLFDTAQNLKLKEIDGITFQHLSYIEPEMLDIQTARANDKGFQPLGQQAFDFVKGYRGSPQIDTDVLWQELDKVKKIGGLDVFIFPDFSQAELKAYYSPDAYKNFGKRRCKFGYFEATVMPDGKFTTCMNIELGNYSSTSFMDAWRGEKWNEYRKFFAKNTLPYCVRCCGLYRY